jgi:hypothetical protein
MVTNEPFRTSSDDDALLRQQVEDGSLPPELFGHREHLRLAWSFLAEEEDFAIAAARFRGALRRYASSSRVGANAKYHETITWAWLAIIREAMEGRVDASSRDFLAARPDLLDQRSLSNIYDVPAIARDPLARRILVLPKRQALG